MTSAPPVVNTPGLLRHYRRLMILYASMRDGTARRHAAASRMAAMSSVLGIFLALDAIISLPPIIPGFARSRFAKGHGHKMREGRASRCSAGVSLFAPATTNYHRFAMPLMARAAIGLFDIDSRRGRGRTFLLGDMGCDFLAVGRARMLSAW